MVKIRTIAGTVLTAGLLATAGTSQTPLPQPLPIPKSTPAPSQPLPIPKVQERPAASAPTTPPKLEAIAETRLLMEGLNKPNFEAIAKRLAQKPEDVESWTILRGQALMIAETGNLLMMRPPKGKPAQDAWMAAAAELRTNAATLARSAGVKDYESTTAAYATLAATCNRCHEQFGEKTRVIQLNER